MPTGWGSGPWGTSEWGTGDYDELPPIVQNQAPAPGDTGVSTSVHVTLDLIDPQPAPSGINLATVLIYVEGVIAYNGASDTFPAPFNGAFSARTVITDGFHFVIDKTSNISVGTLIPVRVVAQDNTGNLYDQTYTFSTQLLMPTSPDFDCMDILHGDMPDVLDYTEVTASRGAPWFAFDGFNDLVIYSDDGVVSELEISLPVTNKFTYETSFKPSALPLDLNNLNQYRFFIGAFDQTDNGGGLLLSKAGLAVVGSFGASAAVIPGSAGLIAESETYYTLRVTVDGDINEMNVYITKTADVGPYGHVLRYTTAAPVTPDGQLDSFLVEILGQGSRTIRGKFDTFRLSCTQVLIPNLRPIADPGADQASLMGAPVTFDGSNSYDPEGNQVTYRWFLKEAPLGSRFKLSGAGGVTIDDGDTDGVTPVFSVPGSGAFSADNAPILQPGDTLVVGGVLYTVGLTNWVYDNTTFKYVRDITWNDDEVTLDADTLPDNLSGVSWALNHTSTFFSGTTIYNPFAIPDIQGLYVIQLIVNDGSLDSLPAEALLNIASTTLALGCCPDVSFIWDHLSDFWSLVDDKDKAETVWKGFAQAAAASLLTAWQVDYNKSLLDIQRVFQRRWLSYSTLLNDDADTAAIKIVRGPIYSSNLAAGANVTGETLEVVFDGGTVETVTFTGANPISVANLVSQINTQLGFASSPTPLARSLVDGPNTYLVLEYGLLLQVRPNGSANADLGFSTTAYLQNEMQGSAGAASSVDTLNAFVATAPPAIDFSAQGVGAGDVLVKSGKTHRVQKVAVEGLTLFDDLPDASSSSWLVPSVVTSTINDFSSQLVMAGDLARFEVRNIATNVTTEVLCSVVGAIKEKVGFDPRPLLIAYAGDSNNFETVFLGIKHTQCIPLSDLVVEIPRLQHELKCGPDVLQENADYIIGEVEGVNALCFRDGTFSLTDPPFDLYWAEVTYLDNRPTIEANFGALVDFKVEDLETRSDDLDYLSAVRGLWWAYFGGPAIHKVRVGTQILLGLPFAEEKGTIEQIDEAFSLAEGRILIRDTVNTAVLRSYFYPRPAGLALHTSTNVPIKIGDVVEKFDPLSGGIEVLDYINSPEWARFYVSQGFFTEVEKFFRFLVRGDVDTFNVTNMVFAIDFVKKIKPHYTFPLFVFKKNIGPDAINVDDEVAMKVIKTIYQSTCAEEPGSFRWDDTDGGGLPNHTYDDAPPQFLHDTHRLCPETSVYVLMQATLGAGPWAFDSIWAFDDGDTDGDMVSDDLIPLSGPDSSPPPPYGPLVGTVVFDTPHVAGTFTRAFYV